MLIELISNKLPPISFSFTVSETINFYLIVKKNIQTTKIRRTKLAFPHLFEPEKDASINCLNFVLNQGPQERLDEVTLTAKWVYFHEILEYLQMYEIAAKRITALQAILIDTFFVYHEIYRMLVLYFFHNIFYANS